MLGFCDEIRPLWIVANAMDSVDRKIHGHPWWYDQYFLKTKRIPCYRCGREQVRAEEGAEADGDGDAVAQQWLWQHQVQNQNCRHVPGATLAAMGCAELLCWIVNSSPSFCHTVGGSSFVAALLGVEEEGTEDIRKVAEACLVAALAETGNFAVALAHYCMHMVMVVDKEEKMIGERRA